MNPIRSLPPGNGEAPGATPIAKADRRAIGRLEHRTLLDTVGEHHHS